MSLIIIILVEEKVLLLINPGCLMAPPPLSLQGIGGGASRCLMDHFAEMLFSLNKHCFSLLAVWLKEALQPPGFPSSQVTTLQKDTFSHQILR